MNVEGKAIRLAGLAMAGLTMTMLAAASPASEPILADGTPPTAIVSYADLDLRSSAGVRRLAGRIRSAADRLCETQPGYQPLGVTMHQRACLQAAIASADSQIRQAVARSRQTELASQGVTRRSQR